MHQGKRIGFVDPKLVTGQLAIQLGERVADFGCGAGYFSCAFAERVGATGHVSALDILPASLESVMSRARTLGLTNITAKRANLECEGGSTLDPHSLDWVIIKDMLFQNEHKDTIIYEAARVLKPGGQLFVMEWDKDAKFVGPAEGLRVTRQELEQLLAAAGLTVVKPLEVGQYHFGFLAKKEQ
jgi:ubiquinone/menaquinone biosynthesis C-methylase UbiE